MKTTKITTTLASLTMIFFMSTSSMANINGSYTGDGEKTSVKNHISAVKTKLGTIPVSTSSNEFSRLRFDVNNFVTSDKSEISEIPSANEFEYLRFDVNSFVTSYKSEISEMPSANEFEYLRFDVNDFSVNESTNVNEIPLNEFDYLRFDANKFECKNKISTSELPAL